MEKWLRRIFIFLLASMLWFNIIDSRAIGAQGMEYSEFVTKIENNEISNILVEKNQNRAFVYMKEDSTYYMVKLASFGEMQNLVFNSEEYKNDILTYSVENFDYPPTLTNAFFILVLSFCITLIETSLDCITILSNNNSWLVCHL